MLAPCVHAGLGGSACGHALCYGQAPHWDAGDPDTIGHAIAQCQQCPALARAARGCTRCPRTSGPAGVTAGQVVGPSGAIRKAC
jgi:hypothetical protein